MSTGQETITREAAPERPRLHPIRWARENLFSSVLSTVLTAVFALAALFGIRGILSFIFDPQRRWDSIATNAKLYATLAYPADSLHRVWISLGLVVVLAGLSAAAWGTRPRTSAGKILRTLIIVGGAVAVIAVLAPLSAGATVAGLVAGAVIILVALGIRQAMGPRADEPSIPVMGVIGTLMVLALAAVWVLPAFIEKMEIASSTKVPWTIEVGLAFLAYWAGLSLLRVMKRSRMQQVLVALWFLSLPVIYLVILRAPTFDMDLIVRQDFPIALGAIVVGSLVIWYVSDPQRKNIVGLVGGIIFLLALAVWFPPLSSVVPLIKARVALLLLSLFVFAASTFGGDRRARTILVVAWIVSEAIVAFFIAVGQADLGLEGLQTHYLGGLLLTMVLAFAGILLAFPFGVLLALGRTSSLPIFRLLSVAYIEVIRGVPLITILFFGALFLPLFVPSDIDVDRVLRAVIAISLFGAAYLAENVRGGLQSIPKGQYEAARAVGMTTAQLTIFITLPQALRAVIPALVGQVISLFKDTSLVFIIGLSEILLIGARLIPGQPDFIGTQRENLLFVAFVFWIFTFSFSRASQRLERKLGVGER